MSTTHFDVLIIGAGISGISAAYHIQTESPNKTYAILETRENIGGTWDLFKYPGIRSDSDMYTLGFSFRPWTSEKAIADGPDIMQYLKDSVNEYGIIDHIVFGQQVKTASWSSEKSQWTISSYQKGSGLTVQYTCNFLSMCSGYYNYDHGYTPDFKGKEDFEGLLIHPQKWPTDLSYDDKKIIVIGSGATAVTLVPELAKKASHVTMLQRSPTYIVSAPAKDRFANWMNRNLPLKLAYTIARWRKITYQRITYNLSRKYPKFMKGALVKGAQKEMGKDYDVAKHLTPNYNPWDQRICLVPDGDLFKTIKSGKASIATDHIEAFTPKGIVLKSGDTLEADIIVSATGLNLVTMGGMQFSVDGESIDFSKTVSYKSMMFSDVPNVALSFGYTNASWTLKCDLTSQYICRLLNYMDENGFTKCTPRQNDPTLVLGPWLDFTSGYIQRHLDQLPKSGSKAPWKLDQSYFSDLKVISKGKINDGVMEFE